MAASLPEVNFPLLASISAFRASLPVAKLYAPSINSIDVVTGVIDQVKQDAGSR